MGNLPRLSDQQAVSGDQLQDVSQFEPEDLDEGVVNESKHKNTMSNFLVLERKGKINLSDMHQPSSGMKPLGLSSMGSAVQEAPNKHVTEPPSQSLLPKLQAQATFGAGLPEIGLEKLSQQLFQYAQEK